MNSAQAGAGDAKATAPATDSGVQQTQFVIEPVVEIAPPVALPYTATSKYFGLWQPTEDYGIDARCSPTPFAPRGYGFPKKLAPFRMDYAPYRVRDCGYASMHGPSLWWRRHRDPCCGGSCCGKSGNACRQCERAVDPQ
ncbi:MAG: hypothetical protein U0992_08880 [Planctomycetaceae bacterium]